MRYTLLLITALACISCTTNRIDQATEREFDPDAHMAEITSRKGSLPKYLVVGVPDFPPGRFEQTLDSVRAKANSRYLWEYIRWHPAGYRQICSFLPGMTRIHIHKTFNTNSIERHSEFYLTDEQLALLKAGRKAVVSFIIAADTLNVYDLEMLAQLKAVEALPKLITYAKALKDSSLLYIHKDTTTPENSRERLDMQIKGGANPIKVYGEIMFRSSTTRSFSQVLSTISIILSHQNVSPFELPAAKNAMNQVTISEEAADLLISAAEKYLENMPGADTLGFHFVPIPSGEYRFGKKGIALNSPRKKPLQQFEISTREVTNRQFAAFVRATGYTTDAEKAGWGYTFKAGPDEWHWEKTPGAYWRYPMGPEGKSADELADHPVTQISGEDARAYCRWAGLRLPTLEEWEVAARAGVTTDYPWGDHIKDRVARCNIWEGEDHNHNSMNDGYKYTAPTATYPPNLYGLYDVIGNVFEYCSNAPEYGTSAGGLDIYVYARGGSWWCSANSCNFYNLHDIGRMYKHASFANQGFRVAK